MGRAKTVEINGRKYDATTGKLVSQPSAKPRGVSIDGFTKAKPAQQLHVRTTKSKTLDRKAVSKSKQQITAKKPTAQPSKTPINRNLQSKEQVHKVDKHRQQRALRIKKSNLISKFSRTSNSQPIISESVVTAAPSAPQTIIDNHHQVTAYAPTESNQDKKKVKKAKNPRRFSNFSLSKPKARSVYASVVLVVLLAGYITYLNIPNLSLRIAASRAGIDATIPGYQPSGFAMSGPINYSQGLVTLNFKTKTDSRNFTIAERESSWDSESLLANYVETETTEYVTFQEKGLTIYIYDGANATWVDGGIWYTIEGESQLNSDQLLKIAASM